MLISGLAFADFPFFVVSLQEDLDWRARLDRTGERVTYCYT